jgi:hypothetical protein
MCTLMLLILFMAILLFTILTLATDHPSAATSNTRLGSNVFPSSAMSIINGINNMGQIREVSAQSTENASITAITSGISGNNNQPDNSSNITTTTIPAPLIDISPSQRTALAFVISFITILVITLVVSKIVGNARRSHPNIKTGFNQRRRLVSKSCYISIPSMDFCYHFCIPWYLSCQNIWWST